MGKDLWNRCLFLIVMLYLPVVIIAQGAKVSDTLMTNENVIKGLKAVDTLNMKMSEDTMKRLESVSNDTSAHGAHSLRRLVSDQLPGSLRINARDADSVVARRIDSVGKSIKQKIKGIEDRLVTSLEEQGKNIVKKAQSTITDALPGKSILPSKSSLKKLVKFGGGEITLGGTVRYNEGNVPDPLHYQASLDIRASVSVGMLPFSIGASGTYGDRQFNYQFTRIGFDFNSGAFLDSMRQKAMNNIQKDQLKNMADLNALTSTYESGIKQMDSAYTEVKNTLSYSDLKFALKRYENKYAEELKKSGKETVAKAEDSITTIVHREADSLQSKAETTAAAQKIKELYDSVQTLRRYYEKANELLSQVQEYKTQLQKGYDQAKSLYNDKKQLTQLSDGKDVESINKMLGANKLGFNKLVRVFAYLRKFNIGSSVLNASTLTAMNYRVNGVQFEYNPSFIVSFAAGLNNFRLLDYFKTHTFDDRFIVHSRLGYGDLKKNYVVLNYGFGKILNNTLRTTNNDYASAVTSYLHVFSIETQWVYKKLIQAKGEIAYSLSRHAGETATGITEGTVSKPTLGQIAFAADIKGAIGKGFTYKTTISFLGGSFRNFNEAYQNNNLVRWDLGFSQKMFKNILLVSVKYLGFKNNLDHTAAYGSLLHQPLINLTIHPAKGPVVTIISSPMYQDIRIDTVDQHNTTILHSVSMTYPYFIKELVMATTLNVTILNTRLIGEQSFTNDYNVIASQTIAYRSLTASIDLNYSRSLSTDLAAGEIGASYQFSKRIIAGIGVKGSVIAFSRATYGGNCNIALDLKKAGMLKLKAEQSSVPNFATQSFQNFILANMNYTKKF